MRHYTLLAVLSAVVFAAPACDGLVDPSDNVVDELRGVLEPGFGVQHIVDVSRNGEYSLRVRSLEPSANVFVHIVLGILDQGFCAVLQQNFFVGHNQLALAGPMTEASYCIQVNDPGLGVITEPVEYVLEFSHP